MVSPQDHHPDLINGLADLRAGDIMFGPIGGIVPGIVPVGLGHLILNEAFRIGTMSIRHAGIVVEASRTLPPGTLRHLGTGKYYTPEGHWRDRPHGDYDVYETGVITAPKLVEAMPSGARLVEMRHDTHWTSRHAYVRLPEDYPWQANDAAAIARAMVGTPYSFASYGALAAWRFGVRTDRLYAWINRRREAVIPGMSASKITADIPFAFPAEAICSVLVDQAWTLAGKQVMPHGTRQQIVTPGGLARHLLLRTPGTTWGFPQ